MNNNLRAIVTGGSSGIGKAIALEMLKVGYRVHICGRKLKALEATCAELSCFGEINYFQFDLSNVERINELVNSWNYDLDVLVNNAGICGIERLEEDLNLWRSIIDTNLNGLYFLTKGLVKFIQPGGSIINISSQLGTEGRAGFGAYSASKHALLGLTKCWASELGKKKITVNAICPGWVKTEMAMLDVQKMAQQNNLTTDQMLDQIVQKLDLERFVEPSEIAVLAVFLASVKARAITGQSYFIK